jgi:hypothetical protein
MVAILPLEQRCRGNVAFRLKITVFLPFFSFNKPRTKAQEQSLAKEIKIFAYTQILLKGKNKSNNGW